MIFCMDAAGESYEATVHLRNDEAPSVRKCYPAMSHAQGDVVRMRDCILLKSGTRPKDLPFVAKVSALWENADDGEMMMSLLWYYRPEHTEAGRRLPDLDDEIFASKHRDVCSVACIEDKCYVLTFNEYCRCVPFLIPIPHSHSSFPFLIPIRGGSNPYNPHPTRIFGLPSLALWHFGKETEGERREREMGQRLMLRGHLELLLLPPPFPL